MVNLVIFDLDGTLVQTEKLKARSYARAAIELCPYSLAEEDAIGLYREVVGRSRQEVAQTFVDRFNLAEKAMERLDMSEDVEPWEVFVEIRLEFYKAMIADPQSLRDNQWPYNVDLLAQARRNGCLTALATMSHREDVEHVLEAIGLTAAFDFIATRNDVSLGKPAPEIYTLIATTLDISPQDCIVIEDSPSGVKAAQAAGMCVMAVATPFTSGLLHEGKSLDERWIVDTPDRVIPVFNQLFDACSAV